MGQRIVTGYKGVTPTASVLAAVRAGRVGGVILFADNMPSPPAARRTIDRLRRAASAGRQPRLLVMVDQEGGEVKRLPALPPEVSAAKMGGRPGLGATAADQGQKTGRALARLRFDIDLAPVADIPDGPGSFLRSRAFSRSPGAVARGACAFANGLHRGGVLATLKHFPGLGRARANTDLEATSVQASQRDLMRDLAPYRRCAGGVSLVMMSSASYPALGIGRPAVLAPAAYRLLNALGYRGLTITDALDTPALAHQDRPALQAVKAGVDFLLYTQRRNEGVARNAYRRLLADARADNLSRAALRRTAGRILGFKAGLR